jgi:hypothetical protein
MLLLEVGAQERLREPHAGRRIDFRLAAVERRCGESERPVQHRRQKRQQHERNHQLDQREAARVTDHNGVLAPIFTVDSDSERSRPLSLGNRTSTLTR